MRHPIPIQQFKCSSFTLWNNEWFVLTSGDYSSGKYNCMTISWGSMGIMWNKPFVQVVVRPGRYTFEFMEKYPEFTISHFPASCHSALLILGSLSGREGNKIKKANLTPCPSSSVSAPSFEEADLVFECRKMFSQDFNPKGFLLPEIFDQYSQPDYHKQYFGEILSIQGEKEYSNGIE